MPVTYRIADDVLTLELAGRYEIADIPRQLVAGLDDPVCPRPASLLIDVSRSEELAQRPTADILRIAAMLGPHAERIGGRCAVFAPSPVHFGLSRMGSHAAESVGVEARVFRTREAALRWLRGEPGDGGPVDPAND